MPSLYNLPHIMEYACHAFHDSLPKGRVSGHMEVKDGAIVIRVPGNNDIRLPFEHLEAKRGGANQRLIFFSHPAYSDWSFYTSDRTILNNEQLRSAPHINATFASAKRHHYFGWSLIALVAFLIIAVPALLIFRMDLVTGTVAKHIPPSWEEELGKSSFAQFRMGKSVMDEDEAAALLAPLVKPLLDQLPETPYQYQFYIIEDATLNASALPGGVVMIHSELILEADRAEELLGVLAHEIIHVEAQHGVRNVLGSAGIYIVVSALLGDTSGVFALLSGAAPILLNQSYSRRFEREADHKGYELLEKASIDPSGLADFFFKMKEKEEEMFAEIEDEDTKEMMKTTLGYLSTHPATDERVAKLRALDKTNLDSISLNLDEPFSTLQEAVTRFVGPEDDDDEN